MPMIERDNLAKSIAIASELIEVPEESEFGCTIDKSELEKILDKYSIEYPTGPDGSIYHALFIGRCFSESRCNFNRLTDIAHYYYHLFCGDAPSLIEILEDNDEPEERFVAEGTDTVH